MIRFATIAKLIVMMAALLAITVNFIKPLPASSYVSTVTSEKSESYETDDRYTGKQETRPKKCPCPTEIEKMDCDDGICSVAILQLGPTTYTKRGLKLTALIHTPMPQHLASPEPFPPRHFV